MANPLLRVANESHVPALHGMLVELAVYEHEPDAVAHPHAVAKPVVSTS